MKIFISNSFKCDLGDYDCLRDFQNQKSNDLTMIQKVNESLRNFYTEHKKNPYISSIKITMDDNQFIVNWQVTIEESPDGKSYIGLTSVGCSGTSDGQSGSLSRAFTKINSRKKVILSQISRKSEIVDIADFNFVSKSKGFSIRQIFTMYTNPETHSYLPKSEIKKFVVGKEVEERPEVIDNNGILIPSLSYLKVMDSLFNRNKTH